MRYYEIASRMIRIHGGDFTKDSPEREEGSGSETRRMNIFL